MSKPKKAILSFLIATLIILIFCIAYPVLREPMISILKSCFWIIKDFFLDKIIKSWILYLIIILGASIFGNRLSIKKKNNKWYLATAFVDIVSVITAFINCK